MEFKGTKGEWKAVKLEATDFHTERNEIHYGEDGECVAEFVGNDYDAKLIAAAPELLEALIELKRWVVDTHIASEALNNANKAIDKALN
jgi:hypothetical protein